MFLKSTLTVVILIITLSGGALLLVSNSNPPVPSIPTTITPTPTINFYTCSQDSDCISVQESTCPCSAGGTATSINKEFESIWNNMHPPQICPAVMSGDWSCINSTPRCIQHLCKLVRK